ncbi:hypothetical protein AB0N05_38250 [Nocardia sp. NPDC051030]|uniref:hypothetical protein n=1 Tax=Nocardia sp. NPDC051030 TaxID=3155162 RepID=UPI003425A0CE
MTLAEQVHASVQRFPDGVVLTAADLTGYPVSMRCRLRLDDDELVADRPKWFEAADGPASLLTHSHDEAGEGLRSVLSRGVIESRDGAVFFTPVTLVNNTGSPLQMIGLARQGHRAATAYLRRRNMKRPDIPWDTIKATRASLRKRK